MLKITTPGFKEGEWIPDHHAGFGEDPIHSEQGIAYGKHCYRGPKPPFHGNHAYLLTLFMLECALEASEKSRKGDILTGTEGHILQKAELRGRYQRRHE